MRAYPKNPEHGWVREFFRAPWYVKISGVVIGIVLLIVLGFLTLLFPKIVLGFMVGAFIAWCALALFIWIDDVRYDRK
jgi:hypothetical protein